MRTLLACCFVFALGCSSSQPADSAGQEHKGMHTKGEHKGQPGEWKKGEHKGMHKGAPGAPAPAAPGAPAAPAGGPKA